MRLLALFIIGFLMLGVARAQPPASTEKQMVADLLKGGFVLFIRHPRTNLDEADTDPLHLDNIKAQRQLSDEVARTRRPWDKPCETLRCPSAR